jgi:hypothetical protein
MPEEKKGGILRWSWVLAALALFVAVAAQNLHLGRSLPKPEGAPLSDVVRLTQAGWQTKDLPLGPNEFLSTEAVKVLNYDDMVNREFSRGGTRFGVYAAYWGAGKMPVQLVASHTPDRCWTENGWKCLEMKFRQPIEFEGRALQPAEWRLFEPPAGGSPVYVLYWHLIGGRVYDYGSRFNAVPDPLLWWKGAVQQALLGSREQYFIRITSNEPIDQIWNDQGFAEVIRSLARLGLAKQS